MSGSVRLREWRYAAQSADAGVEHHVSEFGRRLPGTALEEVGRLLSTNSWMRDLLARWAPSGSAGPLRLAIRNGYMNFYRCGQSVARVEFGRGGATPSIRIHEKYVRPATGGGRYLQAAADEGLDERGRRCRWGGAEMLVAWMANSEGHRGAEKRAIDRLLEVSPKVVDLEMGLPAFGGRKGAPRMDMVALEEDGDGARIVFWEAKMIGDPRIRSNGIPEVFEQIASYEEYLGNVGRRTQVARAYRENCRILAAVHELVAARREVEPLDALVRAVSGPGCKLDVECKPRLLIFDDGRERRPGAWERHLEKLRARVAVAVTEPGARAVIEALAMEGG